MRLEEIQTLIGLNKKGLITDEELATMLKAKASVEEKEKTREEIEEENHNRMAEENRKHTQELRVRRDEILKRKEEEKQNAERQDAMEDRAIEDIDFLSKQLNRRGERVYTDAYLDSLPYYKLADLADSIREAKANLEQDREAARQGFNFARPEVPSNESPVNLPESPETITITPDPTAIVAEPVVEAEENTNEEPSIETPQEALDNQITADTTPENNKKPKLISRIGEKLKNKIDGKNAKAIAVLVASVAAISAGILLAPGAMLGLAGGVGAAAAYKEFKKGMGR